MAMRTRWRMPPESWCGKACARRSGSGIPTRRSSSTARRRLAPPDAPSTRRGTSATCAPTVCTGSRPLRGSWKTIASRPRRARRAAGPANGRGSPASSTTPRSARTPGGNKPISALKVRLLPEPDSPTTPREPPAGTSKPTSRTATWRAAPRPTLTVRSDTLSTGTLSTGALSTAACGPVIAGRSLRAGDWGPVIAGVGRPPARRRAAKAPGR